MLKNALLLNAQDGTQDDLTSARRIALLDILRHERYLTRSQLIARVERRLRKNCFGTSAREPIFYRDMQAVKQTLKTAGYLLAYSRRKQQPGYYLQGQPALSAELRRMLRGSAAETRSASD